MNALAEAGKRPTSGPMMAPHPCSAPLPPLPDASDGTPVFCPVLGRGPESAALILRGLVQRGQPRADTAAIKRALRNQKGRLGLLALAQDRALAIATFPDRTALVGVERNGSVAFYPQPLYRTCDGDAEALLRGEAKTAQGLAEAVLSAPPVALSGEAALMGGHLWPTWNTLDLMPLARQRGNALPTAEVALWVSRLVHALPAPVLAQNTKNTPFLDLQVLGRMRTLDGFSDPKGLFTDGAMMAMNPEWYPRLIACLGRLFADLTLFPAWTTLRQTHGGSGTSPLAPGALWTGRVLLEHNGMSAHARLQNARMLPPGTLSA